ncbi:hypothetical protein GOB83_06685 [Acetobacter fabarum]|uniref:hypothetical protein n=1 Tax=Acetobacter fabarum TaxID=483199 RepID=UPI001404E57C|nr:hypothetical protein [Acetobacter fabarum]NHO41880.1 hypothetical protein [Acetobacter fabarum]GBQ36921.1 hypothetical protein AA19596_2102 [Acetobacter fabarum DSM 19596]
MSTKADIFIIESLSPDDEGNGRFEGQVISHVARLHGKQPAYHYVRTRDAFEKAIKTFLRSDFRYLHISAHADHEGLATTNQDEVGNRELGEMLGRRFADRRLFLSACSMVHKKMAADIIPATNCYSVVGPRQDIGFAEAAVFWPALYHLMFEHATHAMSRSALATNLKKLAMLFDVEIGYYARSANRKPGFSTNILKA